MSEQIVTTQPVQKKTMSRRAYSIFTVLFIVTFFFITVIVKAGDKVAASSYEPEVQTICTMLHLLPIITVFLFSFFCMARRLRDCGKNTYCAWFILIPIFGLGYVIYLCFPKRKVLAQN